MALTNSEITTQIETLGNLVKARQLTASQIKSLLGDAYNNPNAPLSMDELNERYQRLTSQRKALVPNFARHNHKDRKQLTDIAIIQLRAIADGFDAAQKLDSTPTNSSYQARSANTNNRSSTVHHIYHYDRPRDNFWRDMILWDMLMGSRRGTTINNNYYGNSQPSNPTSSKKKEDGSEVTVAGIILACLLAGGALATLGYSAMQIFYRVDEIVHAEDMLANTGKLGVTAFAAWQGYMLGALLGAAYFANPLLGAICTAIIASAAGMALSKWGAELSHQATNTTSALSTDPRFCLSKSQKKRYKEDFGLNSDIADEALRECAIAIKNEPTNGLVFWQNPHAEIISLMRNIKTGNVAEQIIINDKLFDLTLPMKAQGQTVENNSIGKDGLSNLNATEELPQAEVQSSTPIVTAVLIPRAEDGYQQQNAKTSQDSTIPTAPEAYKMHM